MYLYVWLYSSFAENMIWVYVICCYRFFDGPYAATGFVSSSSSAMRAYSTCIFLQTTAPPYPLYQRFLTSPLGRNSVSVQIVKHLRFSTRSPSSEGHCNHQDRIPRTRETLRRSDIRSRPLEKKLYRWIQDGMEENTRIGGERGRQPIEVR